MSRIISIGTDRNIFKEGSAVRQRQVEYGGLFGELHLVVFTGLKHSLPAKVQIAPNVWVYGTRSISKLLYIRDACKIAGRIIREQNMTPADTVITVQDPFEAGLVGLRLKKKFGISLHTQVHTDFLSPYFVQGSFLNSLRVKVARKVLGHADAIRVVSKRIAESLSNVSLRPKVVPVVLPIFVDINKIETAPVTVDLKNKYSQFSFIILIASRLTREKNIPFALRVFKRIVNYYPKTGLVIIGSGPELKNLKKVVRDLKIQENVVFESWQNELASYYKTAHLFISTSNYEGYGLTLVEATAAHCPVISTDVGIAPDFVKTCPVGDETSFANQISDVIENIALREQMVHEAQEKLPGVVLKDSQEYLDLYRKNIESAKF